MIRIRHRALLTVVLVTGYSAAEAEVTIRPLAVTGQMLPGVDNATLKHIGSPHINRRGHAVFVGVLENAANEIMTSGVWRTDADNELMLVALDDMRISPSEQAQFGKILSEDNTLVSANLVLSEQGDVAFFGPLAGPGIDSSNNQALFLHHPTTGLSMVARAGDLAPGTSGARFASFAIPTHGGAFLSVNDVGSVVFHANLVGDQVGACNDIGVWSNRSGNLELVVRTGDIAPVAYDVRFEFFGNLKLDNSGLISYFGRVSGPDITADNDEGYWFSPVDGSVRSIYRKNDPILNGDAQRFVGAYELQLAPSGEFAMYGLAHNPSDRVIAITDLADGTLKKLAGFGTELPGGESMQSFGAASGATNRAGDFAFTTNYQGGWIVSPDGSLRSVLRLGETIPGEPLWVLSDIQGMKLNDHGAAALLVVAGVPGPPHRVASLQEPVVGVWAEDSRGNIVEVLRVGDSLDVIDGPAEELRIVSRIGLLQFGNQGQIGLMTYFADGSNGLFLAQLPQVPEPSAVPLAGALVTSLALMRRSLLR